MSFQGKFMSQSCDDSDVHCIPFESTCEIRLKSLGHALMAPMQAETLEYYAVSRDSMRDICQIGLNFEMRVAISHQKAHQDEPFATQ
jgi:hypothetical protein